MAKTITLDVGHTDKDGVEHREVEVSKRLRGADLFTIDDDPQSNIPTQYQHLLWRTSITRFGGLAMPVALTVLASLDSIDLDDIADAYNEVQRGAQDPQILADGKLRLGDGYEHEGVLFDVVEFGHRITGNDYIDADEAGLRDARRAFFLIGRQIKQLSQSEGGATLRGPLGPEAFESFYLNDLYAVRAASEVWRQSFRRARARAAGGGDAAQHIPAGVGDRVDGAADSEPAG